MKTYPVLKSVTPIDGYKLLLIYGEHERRIYNFEPNLKHKYYSSLTDVKLFKKVSVIDGEIFWATGQDFCPHTLYELSVSA